MVAPVLAGRVAAHSVPASLKGLGPVSGRLIAARRWNSSSASAKFDVAVVGGGPGGYVAAIKAAQLGLKTVCIEKRGSLGGTCLNVGCIPSKALLNISHKYAEAQKDFSKMGITFGASAKPSIDVKKMLTQKDKCVKGLTQGIEGLFKKNGVTYVKGAAAFEDPHTLTVSPLDAKSAAPTSVSATNVILATGSEASPMPGGAIKADEKVVVTSTGALKLPKVPKKMLIVGGGVIGLELGSVWSRLGAKVEVVEFMDSITPGLDGEVRKAFQKLLEKQGFKINLSSKVTGADVTPTGATVHYENKAGKHKSDVDVVLLAIGRRPHTAGLGLEKLGIAVDRLGRVQVNEFFRVPTVPSVYAIGDLIEGPMLAHKAEDEGLAVASFLGGGAGAAPPHINYDAIPSVVYTHPEVAGVGKTEEQLKELGVAYKKGSFPMMANSRARTNDDAEGFCKIMTDPSSGKILGAWMISPSAGELIQELALAVETGLPITDIIRTSHAHPTLSEAVREAAMAAWHGKAIHMA